MCICECVRAPTHTHTYCTGHKEFSACLAMSQIIIITQIWFGSRVFWLQFPLLKQSDTHQVLFKASGSHVIYGTEGQSEGGLLQLTRPRCGRCVFGNLFNDSLMLKYVALEGHKCTQCTHSTGKRTINVWERLSVRNWRHSYTWSNNKNQTILHGYLAPLSLQTLNALTLLASVLFIN